MQERVFHCNFLSTPLSSRFFNWVAALAFEVVILCNTHDLKIIIPFCTAILLFPLSWEVSLHYIREKSCIKLTENEIIVSIWIRKVKSYQVQYIEQIEIVDLNSDKWGKYFKDSLYPIGFGRGGDGLIPPTGVLVFFRREYIKSVRPIFLNPSDPELFVKTVNEKRVEFGSDMFSGKKTE